MDIFDKIAIETGMKNKDPQQLFNIEEMNSDNDFENTIILFIQKYLAFADHLFQSEMELQASLGRDYMFLQKIKEQSPHRHFQFR